MRRLNPWLLLVTLALLTVGPLTVGYAEIINVTLKVAGMT